MSTTQEVKYPNVGVCAFIIKDNKILLARRIQIEGFGNGDYALPGGKVDWMEDPVQAVIRETYEETGLTISDITFAGYSNDPFEKANKHFVTLYFIIKHIEGTPTRMEPLKAEEWEWHPLDAIPKNLFCNWLDILGKHIPVKQA